MSAYQILLGLPDWTDNTVLSSSLQSLIAGCLHTDPRARLRLADLPAHPWLQTLGAGQGAGQGAATVTRSTSSGSSSDTPTSGRSSLSSV